VVFGAAAVSSKIGGLTDCAGQAKKCDSRSAMFEEIERSALKPLSAEHCVFAAWKECGVGLDSHVERRACGLFGHRVSHRCQSGLTLISGPHWTCSTQ
jgi:hypothetical protein